MRATCRSRCAACSDGRRRETTGSRRSVPSAGATIVLSLVLYPYVYLLARAAFIEQCFGLFETSRTLGRGPDRKLLYRCGATCASGHRGRAGARADGDAERVRHHRLLRGTDPDRGYLRCLAQHGQHRRSGAARVGAGWRSPSSWFALERISRRSRRYHDTTTRVQALPEYRLSAARGIAALVWCATPVALGFVLPACVLGNYAMVFYAETLEADYLDYVRNTMMLAAWGRRDRGARRHRPRLRGSPLPATGDARARRVRDHRLRDPWRGARGRHHGSARVFRQRARFNEPRAVRHPARAAG